MTLVDETRGNLGVVYAKPSALRRRVFGGLQRVTRAAPPGQRSEESTGSRRLAGLGA